MFEAILLIENQNSSFGSSNVCLGVGDSADLSCSKQTFFISSVVFNGIMPHNPDPSATELEVEFRLQPPPDELPEDETGTWI
ncbi:hypothetical protein AKJ16_DCAP07556 [Drosera capensis]